MSFEHFIEGEQELGTLESQGQFTLDLSKATAKLSEHALPTEYHYLLKLIQLANRLRAPEVFVIIERSRTTLSFQALQKDNSVLSVTHVLQALKDPLADCSHETSDLVSCLLGTFHDDNREIRWKAQQGESEGTIFIDSERNVTSSYSQAEHEVTTACELTIFHKSTWKFWLGAQRRAETSSILVNNCRFSKTRIFIDKLELETGYASVLNSRLNKADTRAGSADRALDAAWNMLFDLAGPEEHALALRRPSMSNYIVRRDVVNLWAQGARYKNGLWPIGELNSSWVTQFLRDGKEVSMRLSRKRDFYKSVLALNKLEQKIEIPGHAIVLRQGVIIHDAQFSTKQVELHEFSGCTLMWSDDELETDLTGFQLVQNEDFINRVLRFKGSLTRAREFFEKAKDLISVPTTSNSRIDQLNARLDELEDL